MRPTARGAAVALAVVLLITLSSLSGVRAARDLAAALIAVLAVSAVCAALASVGLRLRRDVEDPSVTAPGTARAELALAPGALLRRLPVATGTVRCVLPPPLGGPGELDLRPVVPHTIPVAARGVHELGACEIRARDPLGMVRIRRTEEPGGIVVGLPRLEPVDATLAHRVGASPQGTIDARSAGRGEIGPLARPYVAGDDLRRIHWRASARTGDLMTREDEPATARSAVIVLDDRRGPGVGTGVEERIVAVAGSVWSMLRAQGWAVRILDARGDDVVGARTGPPPPSAPLAAPAAEATAAERELMLLALARLAFRDPAEGPTAPPVGGAATGAADGDTALAVVVTSGPVEELSALAGRAPRRLGIAVGTGGAASARLRGPWGVAELPVGAPLDDALRALAGVLR